MLLHGLVATGDIFGRDFDTPADSVVVVPDLLGFGRSLDETRTDFEPEAHLDALDQMLIDLDLADRPLVIGAHSMGAALALRWAARRGAGVERIVCWGAPVYADADAVDEALVSTGVMARLFAADTRWARRACEWNCRHRTAAGWLAAALAPSMPVTIARAASLHSWPAYRDSMAHLVGDTDWRDLAARVTGTGTSLQFVWGEADRIGDRRYLQESTGLHPLVVRGDGHHLPMTRAAWCASQVGTPNTTGCRS
ncbi:MAG: alpha/beta fold hydrolase [Acidimicrobiales bacterium]